MFKESTILTISSKRKMVYQFLKDNDTKPSKVALLYRASTNGWTSANFHEFCDNKGWTLTVIRTKTGKTFGGFTT